MSAFLIMRSTNCGSKWARLTESNSGPKDMLQRANLVRVLGIHEGVITDRSRAVNSSVCALVRPSIPSSVG
jgi:hypothetical protein